MTPIARTLRRALHLGATDSHDDLHFHVGADGRPFVCDLHRCDSPGLSPREAGAAA